MRQYLGPDETANEVRMRRSTWTGSFLILEGATDARFYGRFVCRESTVVANGRENAIEALRILVGEAFDGVAAVVDRDFWVLGEGSPPDIAGLLCTDGRDLEIMALRSPALPRLLEEFGSASKIEDLHRSGTTPVARLLGAASEIGYLRWLCERDKRTPSPDLEGALAHDGPLRLKFQELTFGKFLDRATLKIDRKKLLKVVADHSRQPLHMARVEAALEELRALAREKSYELWDLCSGHDIAELLKIGLCGCFGTNNQAELKRLESIILLAYHDDHFACTELFAAMKAWHAAHPSRPLLTRAWS